MQSRPLKPPDRNHRTAANPPPPPEPPDMSYHIAIVMLTVAKHNLLCRPHANSHFWGFNRHGSGFASYLFMVMGLVGVKISNYTLSVFCLPDIHFSNYQICHDVELVSTVACSHVKGSLQIPNESLDTKMKHQATQLCGKWQYNPIN
ncbi:hypothetical protein A2U01_0001184 [Trifolium medium]|uniref:Uncharacterized protein n=1 Tax=Trifolium medium TaxID=97028 RepID=A0A392LZI2_9FABA|nr:hypothetical protein [Trifolium medium]